MATAGAIVTAADIRPAPGRTDHRERAAARTRRSTSSSPTRPTAVRAGSFDAVLIDAPCSGLGALRRRPDARWRIQPQRSSTSWPACSAGSSTRSAPLVRPGGRLVYSVCTLTAAESIDHPIPDGFEVDDRRAPDRHVAPLRPRVARAAPRGRHRRHGADSVPSTDMSASARRDPAARQGADRQRRRVPRCSRRHRRQGPGRPPGRQRVRRRRSPSHPRRCRRGRRSADRDVRRVRRADRHHRRHRVRTPRPDAGRHACRDRARAPGLAEAMRSDQPLRSAVTRRGRHSWPNDHLQHARVRRRARSSRSTP